MSNLHLPNTDSIEQLARFWDTHDLTDFESELEEVPGAFSRDSSITLHLQSNDAEAIRRIAKTKGVSESELICAWVHEKLQIS